MLLDKGNADMKRICLVLYDMSFTGGVEQVAASLSTQLCDDYEVYIYAIKRENTELAYELDTRVKYYEAPQNMKAPQEKPRLRYILMKTFKPLRKFLCETKIETAILMGNQPAFFSLFARMFLNVRYIYCDHGSLMNEWNDKTITGIRFLDALFSNTVVTLTQRTKADYTRKFHIRKSKVECIYNWVEPRFIENRKPYDTKTKKILSVGRFCEDKGYDLLIQVAKKVLPQNPQWEWHICGDGESFKEIEAMVKAEGLEKQLILRGNVQNISDMYHHYAFLVLTSYREGLPLVLLEAKASGLPLISFDILTGPSEIIRHEQNGYLIQPYNCEEMANCMDILINDIHMRERFSQNAEVGIDKFNQKYIIEQWKHLLG